MKKINFILFALLMGLFAVSCATRAAANVKGVYAVGLPIWSDLSVEALATALIAATEKGATVAVAADPFLNEGGTGQFEPLQHLTDLLLKDGREIEFEFYFGFRDSQAGSDSPSYNQGDPARLDAATFSKRGVAFMKFANKYLDKKVRYRFCPILEASKSYSADEQLTLLAAALTQTSLAVANRTRGITLSSLDGDQVGSHALRTFHFGEATKSLTVTYCPHGTPPSREDVRYSNDGTPVSYENSSVAIFGGVVKSNGTDLGNGGVDMRQMLDSGDDRPTYLFLESFNGIPYYDKTVNGRSVRFWVQPDRHVTPLWKRVDGSNPIVLSNKNASGTMKLS